MSSWPYRAVVFGGGGTRGIAHIGALHALEEALGDGLAGIHIFAGTSFGALVALGCVLGLSAARMAARLNELRVAEFFQPSLKTLVKHAALDRGTQVKALLAGLFQEALATMQLQGAALERRPQEWTFAQLAAATGRKLLVPIMNMEAESIDVCSPSITPDIPVIQAVYASMAIPVLYCPVWLVLPGMRGAFYCDGGMEMNFPMSLLPPGSALGLCLDGEDVPGTAVPKAAPGHPPRRHQSSFVTSVTRLGRVAAKAAAKFTANQLLQLKDEYLPHVVPLHSGSINALTMFHASQPVFQSIVRSLIASGRHSMEQWIKTSSRGLAMRDFITRLRYFRGRHIVLARAYLAILGLYALAFRGYKLIWSACEHQ